MKKELATELQEIRKTLSEFSSVFSKHTNDDRVDFNGIAKTQEAILKQVASIEKNLETSVEMLEEKINKKLDKAVFTMFITIALPVFGGVVWYMAAVNQGFADSLEKYGQVQNENALKIEGTKTDVSWIRSQLEEVNLKKEVTR